jgi:hypothetical protein
MLGLFAPLVGVELMLSCRLLWYTLATSRALRRHWQALSLSVLLLLPAMPVFAQTQILGAPVLEALAPAHSVEWRFAWVHMLEAVGILWVLAQRSAVTGGPFAAFLDSLPPPNSHRRAVDVAVVLVASTPLLLPVLAAAVALAFLPQKAANYLFVIDLLLITLGWQLTVLSRFMRNAIALAVANVFLVGALQAEDTIRHVLLVIPLMLAAFAITYTPPASSMRSERPGSFARRVKGFARANVGLGLSPVATLQIGIVRDRAAGAVGRYLMKGSVTASTYILLGIWGFDTRAVPLALISQAAIALITATTYRDLQAAHLGAAHYMRSLPITATAKTRADMLTVAAMALPFASIVPILLVMHGVLPSWSAVALVCSGAPLVAALWLPQRYVPQQSVLSGIMLAAIWVAVTWQIFV